MSNIELLKGIALYTIFKGKSIDFEELYRVLRRCSRKGCRFNIFREGEIISNGKRIFSVADLPESYRHQRKRRSIFMATTPNKANGFFIPYEPDINKKTSNLLQICCNGKLLFENKELIDKLGLSKEY